jgi:adenylate cyclase
MRRPLFSRIYLIRLRQVLAITVVWMLLAALDVVNSLAIWEGALSIRVQPGSFGRALMLALVGAGLAGLLSGGLLVFFLRERFRQLPFGLTVLLNSGLVSLLNAGITLAVLILAARWMPSSRPDAPLLGQFLHQPGPGMLLRHYLFWLLLAVLTIFALHVNEKYGPGVLRELILGKYHHPRQEERIFMFLDVKGSTVLAECLGHLRFHSLLNAYYRDITIPIINSEGEIYQYVGDMIVVSWSMEKGLHHANCVRCFYRVMETIQRNANRYRELYGLVPEFKAGLHCGEVTTGEIGVIKKDIVYSGDVLNTTARIQSICNKFRVKILLSKYLLEKLNLPPHGFLPKRMGVIELKGKRQKVELYTFQESMDVEQLPPVLSN